MNKRYFKIGMSVRFMTTKYGWVYGTITSKTKGIQISAPSLPGNFYYPEIRMIEIVKTV